MNAIKYDNYIHDSYLNSRERERWENGVKKEKKKLNRYQGQRREFTPSIQNVTLYFCNRSEQNRLHRSHCTAGENAY